VADRRGGTHFEALRRVEPWNPEPLHNVRILPPASCPPILPRARETSTSMLTSEQSNVNPIILHTADSRNLSQSMEAEHSKRVPAIRKIKISLAKRNECWGAAGLTGGSDRKSKGRIIQQFSHMQATFADLVIEAHRRRPPLSLEVAMSQVKMERSL
jgi:hypothetical protein